MKSIKNIIAVSIILIISAFTTFQSINYKIKEGSYSVTFTGGKIKGIMTGLKANIVFNENSPETSKIVATIDARTIKTGSGIMDKHAKSESALNTKAYSLIGFESTSIIGKDGLYEALGKLTIKNITKEVKLPFTFEHKGDDFFFKGKFSIVPKDFTITRMGTPDLLEIDLIIPVTK